MTDATLLLGGRVYSEGRYAETLLVEDGRVVAAGPETTVRRLAPTGTDRVDLGGSLVVPGLADAHLHIGDLARERQAFDARPARSIDDLARRLGRWAEEHPQRPIVGRGLDVESLRERRWPTLQELDAVVSDRSVLLFQASGHAAVLNSQALDRTHGAVGSGLPSGPLSHVLVEERLADVRPVVEEALPVTMEGVEAAVRTLATFGLTSVGSMNSGPGELAALRALARAGRLPIRVRAYPPYGAVVDRTFPSTPEGPHLLAVVGVKIFLDGAFGPRTASLAEPYSDDPGERGVDRGDDAELSTAIDDARRRGLTPALHAIGDRAVARAVRLLGDGKKAGNSGRIEHASLTPPPLFPRLRELGVTLVVQPCFLWSDLWLRHRLGPERTRWAYAFRSLRDLGVTLAGSSDAPFDGLDPWSGMRAAVWRVDGLGRSANPSPDQALSAPEALALYTTAAHRAVGDATGGALAPGAPADLVILSTRRLEDALNAGAMPVRETWVAGTAVVRGAGEGGEPPKSA